MSYALALDAGGYVCLESAGTRFALVVGGPRSTESIVLTRDELAALARYAARMVDTANEREEHRHRRGQQFTTPDWLGEER